MGNVSLHFQGLLCACHSVLTDALTVGIVMLTRFTDVGLRFMEAKEFTQSGTRVQVPAPCLSSDLCVQLSIAGGRGRWEGVTGVVLGWI